MYYIILTYSSTVSVPGVCVLRPWYSIGRVRDDMLWCGQRNMFAAVRHHNEIHRETATDGAGIRRPFDTYMDLDRVAASSQQPQTVLHYIRTVGRR